MIIEARHLWEDDKILNDEEEGYVLEHGILKIFPEKNGYISVYTETEEDIDAGGYQQQTFLRELAYRPDAKVTIVDDYNEGDL